MKTSIAVSIGIGMVFSACTAQAQVKLSGYFIARSECPGYQSIKTKTNPGNMITRENYAYRLVAKNKPAATHYLIEMAADPKQRWVATSCGEHVVPADGSNVVINNGGNTEETKAGEYILAISWQPGFCETKPDKPECSSQTPERFDASHFTLHGLWPQPRQNTYCQVSPEDVSKDKNKRWSDLYELTLEPATREELDKVMPGTRSYLHRHEWIKHGTCYNGETPEQYFRDSLDIMSQINNENSEIRNLFASNIGKEITAEQIAAAFDLAFGTGAGDKIKIACKRDGSRNLITEITVGLKGELGDIPLSEALLNAEEAGDIGCKKGVVDPVGLQ